MQGFQEVVCNGTVFNLNKVTEAQPITFRDASADPQAGSVRFGLTFFLVLGIMALFGFLSVLWAVRTVVLRRRNGLSTKKI
jgi:hypothetical protein